MYEGIQRTQQRTWFVDEFNTMGLPTTLKKTT